MPPSLATGNPSSPPHDPGGSSKLPDSSDGGRAPADLGGIWTVVPNRRSGKKPMGSQNPKPSFRRQLSSLLGRPPKQDGRRSLASTSSSQGNSRVFNSFDQSLGNSGKGNFQNGKAVPLNSQSSTVWKFQSEAKSSSWKDICLFGRKIAGDFSLEFKPPSISSDGGLFASISREEIAENISKWSNTLVGYVVGDKPFYAHLNACVRRLWRIKGNLNIYSRENGFFFFKFEIKEEFNRVLNEGPWLFDGKLIILKQWSENIGLERDLLSSMPIWVRFPSLHLKLWSKAILSKVASIIGYPLCIDKATATVERLAYARCFIEIKASSSFPNNIKLEIVNGEIIDIPVEYEWIPPICSKCKNFGHELKQCPSKEKWVEKGTMKDDQQSAFPEDSDNVDNGSTIKHPAASSIHTSAMVKETLNPNIVSSDHGSEVQFPLIPNVVSRAHGPDVPSSFGEPDVQSLSLDGLSSRATNSILLDSPMQILSVHASATVIADISDTSLGLHPGRSSVGPQSNLALAAPAPARADLPHVAFGDLHDFSAIGMSDPSLETLASKDISGINSKSGKSVLQVHSQAVNQQEQDLLMQDIVSPEPGKYLDGQHLPASKVQVAAGMSDAGFLLAVSSDFQELPQGSSGEFQEFSDARLETFDSKVSPGINSDPGNSGPLVHSQAEAITQQKQDLLVQEKASSVSDTDLLEQGEVSTVPGRFLSAESAEFVLKANPDPLLGMSQHNLPSADQDVPQPSPQPSPQALLQSSICPVGSLPPSDLTPSRHSLKSPRLQQVFKEDYLRDELTKSFPISVAVPDTAVMNLAMQAPVAVSDTAVKNLAMQAIPLVASSISGSNALAAAQTLMPGLAMSETPSVDLSSSSLSLAKQLQQVGPEHALNLGAPALNDTLPYSAGHASHVFNAQLQNSDAPPNPRNPSGMLSLHEQASSDARARAVFHQESPGIIQVNSASEMPHTSMVFPSLELSGKGAAHFQNGASKEPLRHQEALIDDSSSEEDQGLKLTGPIAYENPEWIALREEILAANHAKGKGKMKEKKAPKSVNGKGLPLRRSSRNRN